MDAYLISIHHVNNAICEAESAGLFAASKFSPFRMLFAPSTSLVSFRIYYNIALGLTKLMKSQSVL